MLFRSTYAFNYPFYKTLRAQAVFDHAHNDYLELLSEGGVVGLGLCAWGIIRFASATVNVRVAGERRPALVVWTLMAGVAGVLLHSLVDFGLQVPGNVFCVLLVAAVAIRVAEDPGLAEPPAHLQQSIRGASPLLSGRGLRMTDVRCHIHPAWMTDPLTLDHRQPFHRPLGFSVQSFPKRTA